MKQETIAQFKNILHSKNYLPYYNKKASQVLDNACLEAINSNNGTVWYSDFIEPTADYLCTAFEKGIFLPQSYDRKQKADSEQIRLRMTEIAKAQLKKLSANNPKSFQVGNIYDILKEKYNIQGLDSIKLEIEPKFDDLERLLDTAEYLGKRHFEKFSGFYPRYDWKEYPTILEDIKDYFNEAKASEDEYMQEKSIINIRTIYLKALGKTPIAYTNSGSALNFIKPYLGKRPKEGRNVIIPLKI